MLRACAYTGCDCAAQPKTYVKGSSRDETSSGVNALVGIGAAVLGALVLGAGVLGGGVNGGVSESLSSLYFTHP